MVDVYINDETGIFGDELSGVIKSVVTKAAEHEDFTVHSEVNILIVDNESIREINREHREIDSPTDVLSFPMEDFGEDGILGDIVISLERAKEQAEEYGHALKREIAFLTAHGMFHLFGYDHMTESEEKEMMDMQEQVLSELGITR